MKGQLKQFIGDFRILHSTCILIVFLKDGGARWRGQTVAVCLHVHLSLSEDGQIITGS